MMRGVGFPLALIVIVSSRSSAADPVWPRHVERLVCELASKKLVEEKATGEICSAIRSKFAEIPEAACTEAVERLWEPKVFKKRGAARTVLKTCSPSLVSEESVDPAEIEELLCKLASEKPVEEKATGEICSMVHSKFGEIPEATCTEVVEEAWDTLLKKCPPSLVSEESVDPAEIEELLCKLASEKPVEEKATGEICSMVHSKFAEIPEAACTEVVEKAWEALLKKCPPSLVSEESEERDVTFIV